jgi:hypothetical protein
VNGAKLTPEQTRAQDALFVSQCSLAGLRPKLPLQWPTPAETPASPKKSYRSEYRYLWCAALEDAQQVITWKDLSEFDLLLRLVDFSGLRPVLAQLLGWESGRGWEPFDPVSFFLLVSWQIANRWRRSQMLKNLADERYADYAHAFGFRAGGYPTEGGVRYFLTTLGRHSEAGNVTVSVKQGETLLQVAVQKLNLLLVQAVSMLRQTLVLSPTAWEQALLLSTLHSRESPSLCGQSQRTAGLRLRHTRLCAVLPPGDPARSPSPLYLLHRHQSTCRQPQPHSPSG